MSILQSLILLEIRKIHSSISFKLISENELFLLFVFLKVPFKPNTNIIQLHIDFLKEAEKYSNFLNFIWIGVYLYKKSYSAKMCTLGERVIEYKFEDLELRRVAINTESVSVKSAY